MTKSLITSTDTLSKLKEMLIVFTTSNHLKMTILALEYVKHTLGDADLLIVDDASIDGTVEYLTKKGYAVISKKTANGLTASWNTGFDLAVALGYRSVVFMNNDVLVSVNGMRLLKLTLRREVLMVPLTTTLGAGHNPTQVSTIVCVCVCVWQ